MHSENRSIFASSEHAKNYCASADTMSAIDITANATGPVTIPMTNDYLFRALLQRNNKVLRGLISSLLHLPIAKISSVEITNPIMLGKSLHEKDFILDIKVLLNNNAIINLEMQVIHEHNWTDRSLTYLCRAFDQLNTGDDYSRIKPVIQIGFLDFTLFPEAPEFYATYKMLNVKTHALYSGKITLSVVNLTRIDLATEEDKQYQIDYWASLFKARTWEEIKMLAEQNEYIKEAADTIYLMSHDEAIREQCQAREDYYRRQRTMQYYLEKAETDKAAAEEGRIAAEQRADAAEQRADVAEQRADKSEAENALLKAKIAELEATLAARP